MSLQDASSPSSDRRPASRDEAAERARAAARRHVRWLVLRVLGMFAWIRGLSPRAVLSRRLEPPEGRSSAPAPRAEQPTARAQPTSPNADVENATTQRWRTIRRWLLLLLTGVAIGCRASFRALRAGLLHARRVGAPAAARAGAWLWSNRAGAFALLLRVCWWTALLLAIRGGASLGDSASATPLEATLPGFIAGFALCAFVLVLARPWRLRVGAFALGFVHGALALLTWVVTTPL